MLQIVLCLLNLLVDALNLVVSLLDIKARDTDKWQAHQMLNILLVYLLTQLLYIRLQSLCYSSVSLLNALLALQRLIELILDKYSLQRNLVPLVVQLAQLNLQLLTQQILCMLCRVAENIANPHKLRVLVLNNARVWRDRYLAKGKCIERVDSLIARLARRDMNNNLRI